ncbi:MAG: AAC(3) family N-acetyltransferase [Hydrogenophaga sp.]|jgi:aminoglycoside N3'-acetyltransferase|nr:AAC(3) family N-acetyltransferase [Hydrogenophaga sp.]
MFSAAKDMLRAVWHGVEKKRRAAELRKTQPHVTAERITADLRQMGIRAGDVLFVHSSMKSLGYVQGGPQAVVQGLLDAVGPQGTVMLPTYYMPGGTILGTCQLKDYVFDLRQHGTHMGALPDAFLQFPGVQRSIHPTHSVSAIGPQARYLTEAHHRAPSVFGKGSPWQRFHELNGRVLGLGISMGPVTFYHLLEDTLGAAFPLPVWADETYQLPCKGWEGEDLVVPVRPYRPELMALRIDQKPREDLRDFMKQTLLAEGVLHTGQVGTAASWHLTAHDFYSALLRLSQRGITIYSRPEELNGLSVQAAAPAAAGLGER